MLQANMNILCFALRYVCYAEGQRKQGEMRAVSALSHRHKANVFQALIPVVPRRKETAISSQQARTEGLFLSYTGALMSLLPD